jgi:hypothetical protein
MVALTPFPIFLGCVYTGAEKHTGEYVASEMAASIDKHVPAWKLIGIVTDSCPAMCLTRKLLGERYPHCSAYGCFSHALHNLSLDVIKSSAETTQLFHDALKIVQLIRQKPRVGAIFQEQRGRQSCPRDLEMPTATRWGSAQKMFERLLENRLALVTCFADPRLAMHKAVLENKATVSSESFWSLCEFIGKFLKVIVCDIATCESDDPNLCRVLEFFIQIRLRMSKMIIPAELAGSTFKSSVEASFKRRCGSAITPEAVAAYFLDVRNWQENPDGTPSVSESSLAVRHEIVRCYEGRALGIVQACARRLIEADVEFIAQVAAEWSAFLAKRGPFDAMSDGGACLFSNGMVKDPISWWSGVAQPRGAKALATLAVRLLSLPASSAAVERNFRVFKSLQENLRRGRLSHETAEAMVSIVFNSRLLPISQAGGRVEAETKGETSSSGADEGEEDDALELEDRDDAPDGESPSSSLVP